MRQLLYVSSGTDTQRKADVGGILEQSRHNNAIDGITGLLWTDGTRFLQVLEGEDESIDAAFARIREDPRHRAIVVLHDRQIETREFGEWTMAQRRPTDAADEFDVRMRRLLADASDSIKGTFLGLIAARAG